MERKRLRVDGIPTDIPAGRARDKLTIHFLRSRNGGGEVENIDIIQGNPTYAIVTFEDDEVVENVLRIKDHHLRVNDKTYNLVVSEATGKMDLDEVFLKLSLTVNYRKIPESCKSLLKSLIQTHKDVKFDDKSMTCTISGPYAEIQSLTEEILSKMEIGNTKLKQISSDTRKKTKTERPLNHSDAQDLEQRSVLLYKGTDEETYSQTESLQQLQEPFVWDSDIFKYIQKFNSLDYQEILNKYHVHAVDESSDGITTIYLETVIGGKPNLGDLRNARSRLMELYQGLELLLRKEQIDKRDVYGDQNFHRTLLRDLQKLYPMLLCHDDDQYLYLIGNGVDVAHGKQYISDVQMTFDRPSSYLDTQFKAGEASTMMSEGRSHSFSPSYKYESKVGSRIAASFTNRAPPSSFPTKSPIDEKYLVSSPSKYLLEQEKDPPIDSTSLTSTITSDHQKTEDFSLSQADEKSESKTMPSLKRRDVLPTLKTGRDDIRHSRVTTKATGPLKPNRYTKASSELPYSSLVDVNPAFMDFKMPEVKLRRSNSLSRVYSKESASSEHPSNISIFKDEVIVADWLWHYIKEIHKSDIESWCAGILLTEEEKENGKVTLKLKATNKSTLTLTKERLQLLCWKEDISVTNSCHDYATLGVEGPDDSALIEWCDLFHKSFKKLSVKLQKDKLVLIYPKEIQAHVLDEYSRHMESKMNSLKDDMMADNKQPSLHLKDQSDSSGNNLVNDYFTKKKQSFKDKQPSNPKYEPLSFHLGGEDVSQTNSHGANKDLADEKFSPLFGTEPFQGITHEHKAFFNSPVPEYLHEKSSHPKEHQDIFEDTKNRSTTEKLQMDFHTSRKHLENVVTEVKTYDHSPYTSELLTSDVKISQPNVQNQTAQELQYGEKSISTEGHVLQYQSSSELRIPAVGQESEIMDSTCDQCKNKCKVAEKYGPNLCLKCYAASFMSAFNNKANGTLRVSMTHKSMTMRLPGYERDTTLKIIYEVPDGVQGAGDPHPGYKYEGGKFEAYLPDNSEGQKLLSLLQKALDKGLIFHIKTLETGDRVMWYKIPHKTSPDGGKQKNGYPDLKYMKSTIALLKENGIE